MVSLYVDQSSLVSLLVVPSPVAVAGETNPSLSDLI